MQSLNLQADAGGSTAWGTPFNLNPRSASFINGVSAHAFELDNSGGCDHSGAVVVPAALAILPLVPGQISGKQLLTSILMGYEVGRRVLEAAGGYEKHNGTGWHSTGTCGVFAAAAAVGLLLQLDEKKLMQALGITCSFSGGTWNFIHDGSPSKKLHPGRAAEGGLTAALLAAGGFAGPSNIFEPDAWGSFFKTFAAGHANPAILTEKFGENWRLDRCSIKPYATCRGTHSAIDAVRALLSAHRLSAGQIAAIGVDMSSFQFGMCGGKSITSRAEAQMSLPYAVAAELHFGKVGLAEIEPNAWLSPNIHEWLDRITVRADTGMPDEDEPIITITTDDGRQFTETVAYPYGSPANPLPDDQVMAKFFDLSGGILAPARLSEIRDAILNLDAFVDVRTLPLLLRQGSSSDLAI